MRAPAALRPAGRATLQGEVLTGLQHTRRESEERRGGGERWGRERGCGGPIRARGGAGRGVMRGARRDSHSFCTVLSICKVAPPPTRPRCADAVLRPCKVTLHTACAGRGSRAAATGARGAPRGGGARHHAAGLLRARLPLAPPRCALRPQAGALYTRTNENFTPRPCKAARPPKRCMR